MEEWLELRVSEKHAWRVFADTEGKRLGSSVRKVLVRSDGPRLEAVAGYQRELLSSEEGFFFAGWQYHRKYSAEEIGSAAILQLKITSAFEPSGEECGTLFDESTACPVCGAGRTQITDLYLHRVPKSKDISRTIGEEWVVSERLGRALESRGMGGIKLGEIRGRSGRAVETRSCQLLPLGPRISMAPRTRFGIDPFDEDRLGRYACPMGDTLGLNVLSEIWIRDSLPKGIDFTVTREYIGVKRGLLIPKPLILISDRMRQVLKDVGAKGYELEVVHLDN